MTVSRRGFIGGVLSGFIGSGGAFFMTPGMMNLGTPGVVAVASNITHKFGKAMVGSRHHGKMGNVDKRLSLFMVATSLVGTWFAVWVNSTLFRIGGDSHGAGGGSGASDLYISAVFILILSFVALSMLKDVMGKKKDADSAPSRRLTDWLSRLYMPPYVHLKVADVRVSLWIILAAGLATDVVGVRGVVVEVGGAVEGAVDRRVELRERGRVARGHRQVHDLVDRKKLGQGDVVLVKASRGLRFEIGVRRVNGIADCPRGRARDIEPAASCPTPSRADSSGCGQ